MDRRNRGTRARKSRWRWARRGAIALALLAALLAAPILWVETACQAPGSARRPAGDFAPVITEAPWKRGQVATYLSYPEWYIVHAYEDLAGVMKRGDETDFAYASSIRGFWSSLCELTRVATGRGAVPGEWKGTLYVIGVSFSVEMAIKGAYENTVGRFTRRVRGGLKTAEDRFALAIAEDYAKFLRQAPWYEYPFARTLARLWSGPALGEASWLRSLERRAALSLEWGVKIGYAKLIGQLAGLAPADLRLRSVVSGATPADLAREPRIKIVQALAGGALLIETPRYREFTGIVQDLLTDGRTIVEIAGNEDVLVTAQVLDEVQFESPDARVLFTLPIQGRPGWKRIGLDVKVPALGAVRERLAAVSGEFEHLYDY